MKQNNFWLRTLNIRSDEVWLVKKLFLLQFFQGAGIAFFFTSSFALFLNRFPITELPYVFIYSSLLLWIVGFIYSRIEHIFHINKLAIFITLFIAASILFFRFAFNYIQTGWFLYWMLAWFNVLYLLNNLEFWGVASLLFDARQSKRLFGVISAGDIPAKFIGYSLALLTVEYIGTINLLWAGVVCMLASLPFLISIGKSTQVIEPTHKKKKHSGHSVDEISRVVKNFSGNLLIRRLAILGIIISVSFITINFAFYAGVKKEYHDDVSLAKFIALFLAIVRIVALVVKMIFTGRLINKLGITKSLLITPLVLLILITVIILTQNLMGYQKFIVYFFGATYIVVDILRSSINSPVFLTIMQPLSTHERLRAHTIVKGIMDPFASLITGVALLFIIHYQKDVNLITLSYVLFVICFFWIIGIYRVNSQYLQTIVKTIGNRYFDRENFSISDSGTLDWLKEKAKASTETEAINILSMLLKSGKSIPVDLQMALLNHPSEIVKITALQQVNHESYASLAEFLRTFLDTNNSPKMIAETIKLMCRNNADSQVILPYLDNNDPEIRQAALSGLIYYGTGEYKDRAIAVLHKSISSTDFKERKMVADILSMEEVFDKKDMILQLMNDENEGVRESAFLAAGKSGDQRLLEELMSKISTDEIAIMQPLYVAGENSLPVVLSSITGANSTQLQKEKLIFLIGRIGGDKAQKILLDLLISHAGEYMNIVKAMYRSNYKPLHEANEIFISVIKKLLTRSAVIIYMQNRLVEQNDKYKLLITSFNLELNGLRETLLYVFAMLYDRENINKVRTAYATGKKETIINAMEIIDITVRKDLAGHFNIIFEPGDISERMHDLRKIYPAEFFEHIEMVLTRILAEEKTTYNNWTMACSLYTTKKQNHNIDNILIKKYTVAENQMVRETAVFAL